MIDGLIAFRAFDQLYYGNSDNSNLGLAIVRFGPVGYPQDKIFSDCDNDRIFGGTFSMSAGYIEHTLTNFEPHWSYRLMATVYLIGNIQQII